ncbi:MAG: protein-L-isoaspartate(D-aspartate) O-methyltransferase [Myxococcota bacterium]
MNPASRVATALKLVSRAEFVPPAQRRFVDEDRPLPIGEGQTTSQPSLIAWMLERLGLDARSRVLEVGTGCGYQTALLSLLAKEVYSLDIVPSLVEQARATLERLGHRNVQVRCGDGYAGWPEAAPFDAIIVAAGAPAIPPPLVEQLKPGGRMIIPLGRDESMYLALVTKSASGEVHVEKSLAVRFVPFTGAFGGVKAEFST